MRIRVRLRPDGRDDGLLVGQPPQKVISPLSPTAAEVISPDPVPVDEDAEFDLLLQAARQPLAIRP